MPDLDNSRDPWAALEAAHQNLLDALAESAASKAERHLEGFRKLDRAMRKAELTLLKGGRDV